jgi:outer membrane protein OmpA-like peptidoglycan-associated protein
VDADKYTPITYANAQTLLNEAEAILNNNRRSETSAQEKAEAAEIQAKHAIYLTKQILWLKKNPNEWENFILDRETLIGALSSELGFTASFDEGLDKPLKQSIRIAMTLQEDKRNLLAEVEEKNAEIQQANQQLQRYREKEQGLQAELQEKQYRLEQKRRREDLIASVNNLFSSDQAIVLQKGDDLILRLIGLTFASGKGVIQPEYFSLLTTVQRAIRKFPNAAIAIEGHTDSVGDNRYNENLSYERALAVKKYIIANMGFDDAQVTAVGYGETRPIASNETADGRARNRRIDVVINIGAATL